MNSECLIDPNNRAVHGDGWKIRADWIYCRDGYWVALAHIRLGLSLLLQAAYDGSGFDVPIQSRGQIWMEAWEGHPEDTDGVAVWAPDEPTAIAKIPLCGCGDRGCGNVGRQLEGFLDPRRIPELVDLLRQLPWAEQPPTWEQAITAPQLGRLFWDRDEQPVLAPASRGARQEGPGGVNERQPSTRGLIRLPAGDARSSMRAEAL